MSDTHVSEQALLSSLLVDPSNVDRVTSVVFATDFADSHLGDFYQACVTAHEANQPIGDPKVLLPELRRAGVHESVSNAGFIGQLIVAGHAAHATFYARQVADASALRRYAAIGQELVNRASHGDMKPDELAGWLDAQACGIGHAESDQIRTAGEIAEEYITNLSTTRHRDRIVFTGIPCLDETVGGWLPGEMVVIAARTSVGKTALAMQLAGYAAAQGRSVLYASLEMSDLELIGRILCGDAEVDSRRVRTGQQTAVDIDAINWAASRIYDHQLRVWSPKRKPTLGQIRANAKRVKAAAGLDMLVVDYMNQVQPNDRRRDRHEQISQLSGDLKEAARELEVPVIALAQLNREATKGVPQLSHLRESGAIEQDADSVLMLHRDDLRATKTDLIVAKHRNGETGTLELEWVPSRTRFEERMPENYDPGLSF